MEPKGINIPGLMQGPTISIKSEKKNEPPVRPVQETTDTEMALLTEAGPKEQKISISITKEDAQEAVAMLKRELKDLPSIEVDWKFNRDAGLLVVQVKDKETGRVLREIPPEQILEILEGGPNQGIIIDKKA